ncbi:MAG TPA: oligosaccharide flippase family protein, partial [Gemmatimonadaceae bacterium]
MRPLRTLAPRLEALLLERRLLHGAAWLFAGALMARVTALVASLLVARALGLPSFGKFGMLQSTLLMFQTFAAFGLGETATKYLAELRATDPERAGRIAGLSTTTAVVAGVAFASLLFFLAPVIARRALQAPELEGALRVSAPALFFGALTGAQTGALAGLEAFRAMARVNAIAGLLTLPLLVGGVYLGGLTGGVWGLVLISAGTWLANKLVLRREFERSNVTIRFRGCVRELPVLWGFSLPAVLGGAMVVPVHWLCATLLVQRPGGYAEMGLFNAANQWHQALLFIPTLVSQAVLPILANRLGTGERERALGTLRSAIRANAVFSAAIALVLAALSPWIMQSYGAGFRAGWPTLTIVVLTSVLFAISVPVGQFIAASGKMWVGFAMNSGWALAYFVFSMGLVQFGARGLAGARFLA